VAIGAVNCVKIQGRSLLGFNTDYLGFKQDLLEHQLYTQGSKALILGTGGSSKAVAYALDQLNIPYIKVSSAMKPDAIRYEDITAEVLAGHTLVINTTPLGMFPQVDAYPPIPYQYLNSSHILYDLIYNPLETLFLAQGKAHGAKTIHGYQMLLNQAQASWEIWK
jgi:shikimate dehydrogenase